MHAVLTCKCVMKFTAMSLLCFDCETHEYANIVLQGKESLGEVFYFMG